MANISNKELFVELAYNGVIRTLKISIRRIRLACIMESLKIIIEMAMELWNIMMDNYILGAGLMAVKMGGGKTIEMINN